MCLKQASFLFGFLLTTLTQWSTASFQLQAPPSSSAEPCVFAAVTISMAPTAIRASITARWALCIKDMGEGDKMSEVGPLTVKARQHKSIVNTLCQTSRTASCRTELLDDSNCLTTSIYQKNPLGVTGSQLWVSRNSFTAVDVGELWTVCTAIKEAIDTSVSQSVTP